MVTLLARFAIVLEFRFIEQRSFNPGQRHHHVVSDDVSRRGRERRESKRD